MKTHPEIVINVMHLMTYVPFGRSNISIGRFDGGGRLSKLDIIEAVPDKVVGVKN